MIFAWRPGSQYSVAATRGADSALASDCRAQFGRPSTRRGCRICVTVRLPVPPRGETMYWQANANTPLSVTPLLNVPYISSTQSDFDFQLLSLQVATQFGTTLLGVTLPHLPCEIFSGFRGRLVKSATVGVLGSTLPDPLKTAILKGLQIRSGPSRSLKAPFS